VWPTAQQARVNVGKYCSSIINGAGDCLASLMSKVLGSGEEGTMAVTTRQVRYARINRRQPPVQETLAMRSFAEDLTELTESHLTQFTQPDPQTDETRTWTAADMSVQLDGDFMTGILGFYVPGSTHD
jgi:hypothetical protein